ncbi:ATP-binding protein [Pseudobacter ginsenosidimutans]|uniref:histidine kinase n=1 Tax=Pseudobacter ginsenosidimutans TaxID=661488 RepID=A0A4Q7N2W5_9BACT|nr:ATP-binding protein [Pseudobacter ginsenosidimutans]QEC43915.1 response regulator [Pseudobacter ginsenosidimutans]RZS75344.1 signal transduction histidine kinase [Pseudobacter ginsenosidimutans]
MSNANHILEQQFRLLQQENEMLRSGRFPHTNAVNVPEELRPVFNVAEGTVREYFRDFKMDPGCGTIEINDQRYVLVRASAFSKGFLETIQGLYADKGPSEAFAIGRNFLFDYAHVIGTHDARDFHQKMNLTDPIARLSAGPVHFAWSGWAFVNIHPESNPSPDDDFLLLYDHPYSFEADSWIRAGAISKEPVCVMNSGYSSGWCEESFGLPLTAVEVSCIAKGDAKCSFVMAPPHRIQEHLEKINSKKKYASRKQYNIPTLFERKKVEEEMERSKALAEESAKAKDDFVANMSHELRTPLGAILGFADLLQKTDLDPVQQEYLEAIHTSGKSLLSIINDILDLSKLDAGKFIIESVPFSIPELMHSIQVMFSPRAAGKELRLSCSADLSINYQVTGDPMRLTQILVNLIGNAIKFTDNGSVDVNCIVSREDHDSLELHFTVRDTGIGIEPEKIHSIFDRFTQAESHITRQYGGTGLGLAITKQLIELQGGNIRVKSEMNRGTEFHFMIPYKKAQEQLHPTHTPSNGAPRSFGSFRRILIVEDNLINQKLTSTILHHNGFEVSIAKNGRKAIDLLKESGFDLILMDIQMPVLDGYRTTQLVRDELHIGTPIIAMTAHALSGERDKCLKAGMNDYLAKPFREADLLDKIAYWASLAEGNHDSTHPNFKRIDLSFLLEQTRNNKTFIREMIRIFLKQYPKDREKLKNAISKQDYRQIYKTVHALRNTVGLFGLSSSIGNPLLEMEKLALANEKVENIQQLHNKVLPLFEEAVRELELFKDN